MATRLRTISGRLVRLIISAIAGVLIGLLTLGIFLNPSVGRDGVQAANQQGDGITTQVASVREETGKRWINFRKGESVLAFDVVRFGKHRYTCFYEDAPSAGQIQYGVVNYNSKDLRRAKNDGYRSCTNEMAIPGPRDATGRNKTQKFASSDYALAWRIVLQRANGISVLYDCFVTGKHPDGRATSGVINFYPWEIKGETRCNDRESRPGLRKETGDGGTLNIARRDYAYGWLIVYDGLYHYECDVQGGDHPSGTVTSGVKNPPPGEKNMRDCANVNPRTGPRTATGDGKRLSFGPGADVYGWIVHLDDGRECNPADADGSRSGPGCTLRNAPTSGWIESGVRNYPPAEENLEDLPLWHP